MSEWCPRTNEVHDDGAHGDKMCATYHLAPDAIMLHKQWAGDDYEAEFTGVPLFQVTKKATEDVIEMAEAQGKTLYDIALEATDHVLGEGTYAELNKNNPDPGVQEAIRKGKADGQSDH